ncbi:MAG: prenyltransferase/squalene oxidase repeat-containing protein [Promethearchaeota archaeon]
MKSRSRNIIIAFLILFFTISIIPSVLAKTRSSYLVDFIYSNEIKGEGFKNSILGEDTMIPEPTAYAIDILSGYGFNPHEVPDLQSFLEDHIADMFSSDTVSLYDLYFLLNSLNTLDYTIESDLENKIYRYLNQTQQPDGGFSISNSSSIPSLSSTYFAYQIYPLIGQSFPNITLHGNWILSCKNSDGGYGGNQSLSSTIYNTYNAVFLLDSLEADLADKNQTLNYINSFYVDNPSDINNVGGFLPDTTANNPLLSSTYYCIIIVSIIDNSILNDYFTVNWILSRQNFQDGGFADLTEGTDQSTSSVISSFYAFKTLSKYSALSKLSAEIWMVEFDYMILIIIMASIGAVAGLGVFIWKKRRI